MPSLVVDVMDFDEPAELLAALRGSNDDLWDGLPEQWIFRGHADAGWSLLPSALRANSRLTHHPHKAPGPYTSMQDQLSVEAGKVLSFAEVSNVRGLPVPSGLANARRLLGYDVAPNTRFPQPELLELFALAQHHGIPTRLLDWSRKPLVAAYFAAHGAAEMMNTKSCRSDQRIGIWALNSTALRRSAVPDEQLRIVEPPRYGNPNLVAQDGVFTVHVHPWDTKQAPVCEALDVTLARLYPDPDDVVGSAKIRLLTLPLRKARKLLVRLEAEGVDASVLFPGYDGVARALSERLTHSMSAWVSPAPED